jgi:hypothetical protein
MLKSVLIANRGEIATPPPRGGRGRGGGDVRPAMNVGSIVAVALSPVEENSPHPLTPSPSRGGGKSEAC